MSWGHVVQFTIAPPVYGDSERSRNTQRLRKEYDWRDGIAVGDVLLSLRNGMRRVVRKTSYDKYGFLTAITLSIQRCSWTRRPATTYVRGDLLRLFAPTGCTARVARTRLERELRADIRETMRRRLYCWDVVGVLR